MPHIQTIDVGECYLATFDMLLGMPDDAILVHGYPRCTNEGEHFGKKMGHAWVELDRFDQVWCVDHAHPDKMIHQRIYYHVGQIDEAECKRYTKRQALAHSLRTERPGPWSRQPKDAYFAESSDEPLQ